MFFLKADVFLFIAERFFMTSQDSELDFITSFVSLPLMEDGLFGQIEKSLEG